MADIGDVRRIAAGLPATNVAEVDSEQVRVDVEGKGIAWTWMERVEPRRPRVPRPDVLAVRVADSVDREELLASNPRKFFTEPHYHGFPAVLVRLDLVDTGELAELLTEAWRTKAPKRLVRESGL